MDIKRKVKEKRIIVAGVLLGICVAVISLLCFFYMEKTDAEKKNGRDCKLCESAVFNLHPLQ